MTKQKKKQKLVSELLCKRLTWHSFADWANWGTVYFGFFANQKSLGVTVYHGKSSIILKKRFGSNFGRFFTNSSGHPALVQRRFSGRKNLQPGS
jgi:hypothetical protein